MNGIFTLQKVVDNRKAYVYAIFALKYQALAWAISHTTDVTTWSVLANGLHTMYSTKDAPLKYRSKLHLLKQTGSITDYMIEFRSIFNHISKMHDDDKLVYFLECLKFENRRDVVKSSPSNFKNAVQLALQLETTKGMIVQRRKKTGTAVHWSLYLWI